jgi:hypothetical protein
VATSPERLVATLLFFVCVGVEAETAALSCKIGL